MRNILEYYRSPDLIAFTVALVILYISTSRGVDLQTAAIYSALSFLFLIIVWGLIARITGIHPPKLWRVIEDLLALIF